MLTSLSHDLRAAHTANTAARALTLSRCGEYWSVHFHGRSFCVRDSKGIDDLSRLIDAPTEGLHVLTLFQDQRARENVPQRAVAAQSEGLSVVRHAGAWDEPIDLRARAAYRVRYTQLMEAIEQARERNDVGHIERCQDELEQLLAELQHRRHVGCPATERARKAVYNRLNSAIRRLEQLDRELGSHLRRAVKTGTFCAYEPESLYCASCVDVRLRG